MIIFSKYTRNYSLDDVQILYNMVSDKMVILGPELCNRIQGANHQIDALKSAHPSLYECLADAGMIVEDTVDETENFINTWRKDDAEPKEIKLTVLPTLQCNLRCWYCYENHNGVTRMNERTIAAVKRLIDNTLLNTKIDKLMLDFFGGEPLLYYNQCVKPLVEYANNSCKQFGKRLGVSFTSNGVLLTQEICDFLTTIVGDISFQITLDGDAKEHNAVRFLPGGKGTYETIYKNIVRAVRNGIYVSVRFNYTRRNFHTYKNVLNDFSSLTIEDKRLLDFSFHKVWQEQNDDSMESTIQSTKEQYISTGYDVNISSVLGSTYRCYADNDSDLVVNYNGNIYKCTARDFTPNNSEGVLNPDGTIAWNGRYKKRQEIKYGTKHCQGCSIFPICHGGCSQHKIENFSESCIFGYTDYEKEKLVQTRVYMMLRQYAHKPNNNY